MQPLTIGIDLRALTHGFTSGVTTYIRETVGELLKLDKKNHYFLWWNARHACTFDGAAFRQKNVTLVHTRASNTLLNLNLALRRVPLLDAWIPAAAGIPHKRLDVLWLPDPRPAAVSKNCALVTTVHDLSPTKLPHFFSLKTRVWHRLLDPAAVARRSDRILTPSRTIADELTREWGVYADHVTTTPLGVRSDFKRVTHTTTLARVRKKYGLPQKYILALATLEPRKNLALIVRAFERWKAHTHAPHALVLAGVANPNIFADSVQTPRRGVSANTTIMFPGFIDEDDKAALYSAADAFIAASVYEGFDLPVVESLTTGTPLVASDIPVHREIARDTARYFATHRTEELVAAFTDVLENTNATVRRVRRGQTRARQFVWKQTAKHTLAAIEAAARSHRNG